VLGRTEVRLWRMQNVLHIEELSSLDNNHLMVAEIPVREVVGHMLDVVELKLHSFASPMAAPEPREVDCKLAEDSFAPSGVHTLALALVAHAQSAPSPAFLVPVPASLAPFASAYLSPFLSPAPSLSLADLARNRRDYASLHMQACHNPPLFEVLGEQDRPSCHQTDSHCALADEDFRLIEVEGGH